MKIQQAEWTDWHEGKDLILTLDTVSNPVEQPSFGFEIAWNDPTRWWKPFFVIRLWKTHITFGWLADEPEVM